MQVKTASCYMCGSRGVLFRDLYSSGKDEIPDLKTKNLRTTSMKQSSSLLGGSINRFKPEVDEKERYLEKDREDRKMDFSFSRRLLFRSPFFDWVYPLREPWEKFTKQNYQNIHILIFKKEEYTCSSLKTKSSL